jgi:hypothetical protein
VEVAADEKQLRRITEAFIDTKNCLFRLLCGFSAKPHENIAVDFVLQFGRQGLRVGAGE